MFLFLGFDRQLVEHAFPLGIDGYLVGHHIFHSYAAMFAHPAVRDLPIVQKLDQEGTGDIQNVGRLYRGQFGILGYDRDPLPRRHGLQNIPSEAPRPLPANQSVRLVRHR